MRVFSQINNCQQKQNKKQKQKTDKTKRAAPLLGLAKSIYYIPNSLKVALAIAHWEFGHTEQNAMLCLSDRQTIASQCAIAQCPKQPKQLGIHINTLKKYFFVCDEQHPFEYPSNAHSFNIL